VVWSVLASASSSGCVLRPRMRFASFVCSSVRPFNSETRTEICEKKAETGRIWLICNLHYDFLGCQTSVPLNIYVEFSGYSMIIEGLVVSFWFFFFCVLAEGPFCPFVSLKPIGCMAQFVMWVVFISYSRTRRPFSVLLCDSLVCAEQVRERRNMREKSPFLQGTAA
jgi:hypothetical protein